MKWLDCFSTNSLNSINSAKIVYHPKTIPPPVAGGEAALLKMKKGEEAEVTVKSLYAYGDVGDAELAVPGGADLVYNLTLLDFEQVRSGKAVHL